MNFSLEFTVGVKSNVGGSFSEAAGGHAQVMPIIKFIIKTYQKAKGCRPGVEPATTAGL